VPTIRLSSPSLEVSYSIALPSRHCVNPLNAKLNTICHLLALLGDHHILHLS